MTQSTLDIVAKQAAEWLLKTAIPLWLDHGVDWKGAGYFEGLDPDHLRSDAVFKRLRVLARQIYVFSEGACRGVPRARAAVDHGLAFLFDRARHPEGGFCSRFSLEGQVIDPVRDLYDLAFVLFAFAHAYRLTGDSMLRNEAVALVHFIDRTMRHSEGGYIESLPAVLPRRQNPHMHLFEAALSCAEHMPDPIFDRLADEMGNLFSRRLFHPATGVIPEYYSEGWDVQRQDGKALIEPGHHMEWVWLIEEYRRIRGRTVAGSEALGRFTITYGVNRQTGLLRGELWDDGSVASDSVRLWPHGEWLKAALVAPHLVGDPARAWAALSGFLDGPGRGLWFERWNSVEQCFVRETVPASSLYHITVAIVELCRHSGHWDA